jgi:hypothetical protein
VKTRFEIDQDVARQEIIRKAEEAKRKLSPVHEMATAVNDELMGDDEDAKKGVKRQLRELRGLVDEHVQDHALQAANVTPDLAQCNGEDGVSDRPVHDPGVPYEDLPGDELSSLPMHSTAPVKVLMPSSTLRASVSAYGRIEKADTDALGGARRDPGVNLPPTPGDSSQVAPVRRPAPAPRDVRPPITDGHAADSPDHDGPRCLVSPMRQAQHTAGIGPSFSKPDFGAAPSSPPPASSSTTNTPSSRHVDVRGAVSGGES